MTLASPSVQQPIDPTALIQQLCPVEGGLFAVLDAARDPQIAPLLREHSEPHRCLFIGERAEQLADYAPYLVELGTDSALLRRLVNDGWGHSWGVFLWSQRPFKVVWRQLHKMLTVNTDDGRQLLFRFYDPRVLRAFLPTCTPRQRSQMFGPIATFLYEDEAASGLMRFAQQ